MNRIFLIIFLFFNQIIFFKAFAQVTVYKTLYISSSTGNDENPGTAVLPYKTISNIGKNKRGLRIKLKCGDVFYEKMDRFSDCIIESYGEGPKPVLCGFRVLINSDAWIFTEDRF